MSDKTVTVIMLTSLGGPEIDVQAGSEFTCTPAEAKRLIKAELAKPMGKAGAATRETAVKKQPAKETRAKAKRKAKPKSKAAAKPSFIERAKASARKITKQ